MTSIKMIFTFVFISFAFSVQAEDGVARSAFTTAIEEREPVDQIGQLSNDKNLVYFFTEIKGMSGHTVTHRWQQGDAVQAEVSFNVGGDRWRVWSSKNLDPSLLGEWQVLVVDEGGNVLAQESFAYVPVEQAPADTQQEETMPAANDEPETMTEQPPSDQPPAAPADMTVQ